MKSRPLLAPYPLDDDNVKLPKYVYVDRGQYDHTYDSSWGHNTHLYYKLTLADYMQRKAWVAGVPYGSIRAARLMGSPIQQERIPLREAIRAEGDTLARRAHKFLTLAKEYNERERFAKTRNEPIRQHIPALTGTARVPCKPFESGRNTLPGMERFAE